LALYSGNIANKQGIELILEAADLLRDRRDLVFVLCGDGPHRAAIERKAEGLGNVIFRGLQPAERLGDLLGLATIHLLPQKAEAADLVLPSKLTNMLASGRPVVATAAANTGIAREVAGCGIATPPGNARAFASAIEQLIDDPALHGRLSEAARARAEERWDRRQIVAAFAAEMERTIQAERRKAHVACP
jgi:colanic acid biosynthesis glycosyl transferase WcaI